MNKKISTNELFAISICMSGALFPGFGSPFLLRYGKSTSLITNVLGFLLGLIPLLMMIFIFKKMKNENIFNFNKRKLSILGYIINIILIAIASFIAFINSWSLFNFIISQFLTRNSYYIISLCLCSIIAISVIKGIESIGRTTLLLITILIITMIISSGLLIPNIKIDNLLPILNISKTNFLKSTIMYLSLTSLPIFFLLGINKQKIVDKENYSKKIIISSIFTLIAVTGYLFLILATFGTELSSIFAYPEYTLFKSIRSFEFIQRIENILAIVIYIAYFGNFAYLIYFIKEGINSFIPIKNKITNNILIYILAITIPFISIYSFKKYKLMYLYEITPYIISILLPLIIIVFLISLKKEKQNSSSSK